MEPGNGILGNGLRLLHCGLDVSGEKSRRKSCFRFQNGGLINQAKSGVF